MTPQLRFVLCHSRGLLCWIAAFCLEGEGVILKSVLIQPQIFWELWPPIVIWNQPISLPLLPNTVLVVKQQYFTESEITWKIEPVTWAAVPDIFLWCSQFEKLPLPDFPCSLLLCNPGWRCLPLPYGDWFISYPYPQPEHEIRPKPCMMWTEDQARWVPRRQRSGGDVDSEVFVPENVIPFNEKKLLLCEWCMCEKLEQDDWYVSYLGFVVIRGGGCWTVPGENSGLKQLMQHQRHWLQQGKCAGQRCKTTLRSNW